jgi:Uma2 family endonuclease
MLLGWYFFSQQANWRVTPSSEQRVQISTSRYRIPDVCVISNDAPDELVLRTPPVLCIEILSRGDSMTDILTRVDEYLSIGVPTVWIIDPWLRKAFHASPEGSLHHEPRTLTVKDTPIAISVPELFQRLFSSGK